MWDRVMIREGWSVNQYQMLILSDRFFFLQSSEPQVWRLLRWRMNPNNGSHVYTVAFTNPHPIIVEQQPQKRQTALIRLVASLKIHHPCPFWRYSGEAAVLSRYNFPRLMTCTQCQLYILKVWSYSKTLADTKTYSLFLPFIQRLSA